MRTTFEELRVYPGVKAMRLRVYRAPGVLYTGSERALRAAGLILPAEVVPKGGGALYLGERPPGRPDAMVMREPGNRLTALFASSIAAKRDSAFRRFMAAVLAPVDGGLDA